MHFRIKTQRGYLLEEVISAIQKEIRRGKDRDALYWCYELIPRFEQYMWRRLVTIAHEDIGIANPLVLIAVPVCRQAYFDFRSWDKDGSARLVLANTVTLMARSAKSRLADHIQHVVMDEYTADHGNGCKRIPDYALDKHTSVGRRKRRGFDHWFCEGCVLVPPASEEFERYRREAEEVLQRGISKMDWGGHNTLAKKARHGSDLLLFRDRALDELGKVGLSSENIFNAALVKMESIGGQLEALFLCQAILQCAQKFITLVNRECGNQFGFFVQGDEHPSIAVFCRVILADNALFLLDEAPYLISLSISSSGNGFCAALRPYEVGGTEQETSLLRPTLAAKRWLQRGCEYDC